MPRARSVQSVIIIAVFLAALPRVAASIYTPSMPSLVGYFATTEAAVEFTFTAYIFGLAVGQLIYGPLSDAWGRRPVLLMGLATFALSSLLAAFSPTISALTLGRFLEAVAAASGGVLARAIIRDLMGPASTVRALAYVTMATTLSPAVGPLIGGQFEYYFGWQSSFYALAAGGALLTLASWAFLPETRDERHAAPPGLRGLSHGFVKLARSPAFLAYSFGGGFVMASNLVFFASAPFLLIKVLGISPRDYGLYSLASVIGFMAGNFIVTRVRDVTGTARMMLVGSIISLLGGVLMVAFVVSMELSVWSLIGPFTVVTLGGGIALPNAFAGSLNRYPEIAGTSSSLSGFIAMAMAALATGFLGLLHAASALPSTLLMMGLLGFAVLVAYANPERRAAREQDAPAL